MYQFSDCTAPFTIGVVTDATNTDGGEADASSETANILDRGVCLNYSQVGSISKFSYYLRVKNTL